MVTLSLKHHPVKKATLTLFSLGITLLMVLVISLTSGAYPLSIEVITGAFLSQAGLATGLPIDSTQLNVLYQIRLPRVLMALVVGGGLGIAGAALQGLFRNPLVEPGLIGVSAGAALAAVTIIVFGAGFPLVLNILGSLTLPVAAFLGGLSISFLVFNLAKVGGKTDISLLILAGVALNALAGALIGLAIFYADDAALRSFTFWNLGDVGGANWTKVQIALPVILVASLGLFTQSRGLNAMAIGEAEAFHMGIHVQRLKLVTLILSALIVGVGVSMTGTIGFVGLIVPHLIRLTVGSNHTLLLPASFLLGAILLSMADLVARTIVMPSEMPIGIITAIIGSPFFIWLIINIKKIRN